MNYEALMKKQLLHMPAYRLPPQRARSFWQHLEEEAPCREPAVRRTMRNLS